MLHVDAVQASISPKY